ncbi:MAG: hypothetical protein RBT02_12340 [Bacteroidales bacterium]|nr:hypothetical protein [Bacteroidales bacterium]
MIRKAVIILLIMGLISSPLLCQQEELGIQESAEMIMAVSDDNDPAIMLEELADLKDSPVNINSGDEKEISRLFFLSEFQVMVLADHVRKNGNVATIYELALLPAFDRNTVMLMVPYISLKPTQGKNNRHYGRTTVTTAATTGISSGDEETEGIRSLLKLKHERSMISYGITAENDPGEPFTFRNAPGLDFLSGYIMYRGKKLTDRIIAGDYSLKVGEGLIFSSSTWMGSWLSSPSFMAGRSSAVPYTSTGENNFFRGISITIGNMYAGAMIFGSSNKIDARLLYDEDSIATGVSNLVSGGTHISESQIEARNSLTENIAGFHLTAGSDKIRGGMTASMTWLSLPFRPDKTEPENIHAFSGSRLLNLSTNFKAGTGPILFFTEAALSVPGSWAATAGFRAKPSGRITFNILARHFSPDYYAFHSGAFKAGSGSGNETGIAASLHLEAARHLFITAAADHYRIPWPRYRSSAPSYGSRIEIKGEYLPDDNISLRLTYASSSREYDVTSETGTASSENLTRQLVSLVFSCDLTTRLRLTTRVSASFISPSDEKGYLLCQDISYSFPGIPLRLWYRYALCSGSGYNSRLYAYENDLLSSFSVPALYGEMTRSFIMLSWRPFEKTEVRLKYAFTYSEEDMSAELKHEVKGQVRVIF